MTSNDRKIRHNKAWAILIVHDVIKPQKKTTRNGATLNKNFKVVISARKLDIFNKNKNRNNTLIVYLTAKPHKIEHFFSKTP